MSMTACLTFPWPDIDKALKAFVSTQTKMNASITQSIIQTMAARTALKAMLDGESAEKLLNGEEVKLTSVIGIVLQKQVGNFDTLCIHLIIDF